MVWVYFTQMPGIFRNQAAYRNCFLKIIKMWIVLFCTFKSKKTRKKINDPNEPLEVALDPRVSLSSRL